MQFTLRERFGTCLDAVSNGAAPGEVLAGWLKAERSDFVRLNHARVRQAGSVERATLELRLIRDGRQALHTLTLCGDAGEDLRRVGNGIAALRALVLQASTDPHLSFSDTASRSEHIVPARATPIGELTDTVAQAAGGADLVGFHAAGPIARAMVSSLGHHHWHETVRWNFDYSVCVGGADKAVKACVSDTDWSAQALRESIARSVADAAILTRPAHRIAPGHHRCYLAPSAVADLIGVLGWGGFSARAHASGQSPLARLRAGEVTLDPRVSISEDCSSAGVPSFQSDGYTRPARLSLIEGGRYAQSLVSPRSAREFSLTGNGALDHEAPEALTLAAGDLDERHALAQLGTGISVSNLWYLNFSDRQHCRITGMTRFATVWVEDGEPVAPIEVMRFDDSFHSMFGDALEALGDRSVVIPDTSTYEARSLASTTAPGALLRNLRFTL